MATINCLTSLFGGFAIFSVIGFMAHTLKKEVSEVVSSGKQCDVTILSAGRVSLQKRNAKEIILFLLKKLSGGVLS